MSDVQSELVNGSRERDLLDHGLCLGHDGQDEGGLLIGIEGGRYDQVLTRPQHQELHHLTCINVGFTLGNWCVATEEGGWELPLLRLVL